MRGVKSPTDLSMPLPSCIPTTQGSLARIIISTDDPSPPSGLTGPHHQQHSQAVHPPIGCITPRLREALNDVHTSGTRHWFISNNTSTIRHG